MSLPSNSHCSSLDPYQIGAMVVANPTPACTECVRVAGAVPVVDFSCTRDKVSDQVLKACEEFGFFRVINHGVPGAIVANMEAQAADFFSLPTAEKHRSGPPSPLGYGSRNIGFNGDTGELEYLILPTNPTWISQRARTVCRKDPFSFSSALNEYAKVMKELACEILDMLCERMVLGDCRAFSRLIRDGESDCIIRLNHYPPSFNNSNGTRVGFGEHSDPQLLSILRSNDVEGLQILAPSPDGDVWVPVPAEPATLCISVGDMLQALTNGRLVSVRHRAMANSYCARMSMIYFGGPPIQTRIAPLPETVTPNAPQLYKTFTWGEYKKAMYSLRLGYNRLDLFRADEEEEEEDCEDKVIVMGREDQGS